MRRRRAWSSRSSQDTPPTLDGESHNDHPNDTGDNTNARTGKKRRRPLTTTTASPIPFILFGVTCIAFSVVLIASVKLRHQSVTNQPVATSEHGTTQPTMEPTPTLLVGKRKFSLPEQEIGPEPNEYMDEIQLFEEKAVRLQNERNEAMRESGPVWVQSKRYSVKWRKHMLARGSRKFYDGRIFEELEFEDGKYSNGLSRSAPENTLGDPYYAFDDDIVRTSDEESYLKGCRRTSINRLHRPTCNKIHEHDMYTSIAEQLLMFLGNGAYRDAFRIRTSPLLYNVDDTTDDGTSITSAVFKSMALSNEDYDEQFISHMEMSRLDALVMNLLSQSPRIVDIYGHCGLALMTEYCPTELETNIISKEWYDGTYLPDLEKEPTAKNKLSVGDKLQLALDLAKPIADMHGSHYGVMMHVDIKPDQFRRGVDGVVKLIDFNRANVLLFDDEKEEYCPQNEGGSYSIYRAPEELRSEPQDDKTDIYNYASMVYTILTGLWVHSGHDEDTVRENLINGQMPFYDDRFARKSYGEATLVSILDQAWKDDPDERPDIFWMINLLEEAIEKNAQLKAKGIIGDKWIQYLANTQNAES